MCVCLCVCVCVCVCVLPLLYFTKSSFARYKVQLACGLQCWACTIHWLLQGAVGVITRDAPDVLCHAAVRARNSAVMLAACFDEEELAGIAAWQGQQVQLQLAQVEPQPPPVLLSYIGSSELLAGNAVYSLQILNGLAGLLPLTAWHLIPLVHLAIQIAASLKGADAKVQSCGYTYTLMAPSCMVIKSL